jgi:hypothetical protein
VGDELASARWRLIASWTTAGEGLIAALFRLNR